MSRSVPASRGVPASRAATVAGSPPKPSRRHRTDVGQCPVLWLLCHRRCAIYPHFEDHLAGRSHTVYVCGGPSHRRCLATAVAWPPPLLGHRRCLATAVAWPPPLPGHRRSRAAAIGQTLVNAQFCGFRAIDGVIYPHFRDQLAGRSHTVDVLIGAGPGRAGPGRRREASVRRGRRRCGEFSGLWATAGFVAATGRGPAVTAAPTSPQVAARPATAAALRGRRSRRGDCPRRWQGRPPRPDRWLTGAAVAPTTGRSQQPVHKQKTTKRLLDSRAYLGLIF